MPDPTPEPAAIPPVSPDPAATTPPVVPETPKVEPAADKWDEDRAKATIAAQRESEKKLKAELADARKAQAELDKIKADQLTEQEKAEKRAQDAESKAEAADSKLKAANLLVALTNTDGVKNAKAAAKLIEGVEYDDNGEPTNLDTQVGVLFETFPEQKTDGSTPAPPVPNVNGATGQQGPPAPSLTAEQVAHAEKMGWTPEKYAKWLNVENINDVPESPVPVATT